MLPLCKKISIDFKIFSSMDHLAKILIILPSTGQSCQSVLDDRFDRQNNQGLKLIVHPIKWYDRFSLFINNQQQNIPKKEQT